MFVVFAAVFATDLDVTFVVVFAAVLVGDLAVTFVVVVWVVCVVVLTAGVVDAGATGSRVNVSTDGVFATGATAPFVGRPGSLTTACFAEVTQSARGVL